MVGISLIPASACLLFPAEQEGRTSTTRQSPARPTSPSDGGSRGDWAGPAPDLRDREVSTLQKDPCVQVHTSQGDTHCGNRAAAVVRAMHRDAALTFRAHAAPLLSGAGCFLPTGMGLVDGAASASGVSSKSAYGLKGFGAGSAARLRLAGGADVDRPWLSRLVRGGASALTPVVRGGSPSTLGDGLTNAALNGEATLANSPAEMAGESGPAALHGTLTAQVADSQVPGNNFL